MNTQPSKGWNAQRPWCAVCGRVDRKRGCGDRCSVCAKTDPETARRCLYNQARAELCRGGARVPGTKHGLRIRATRYGVRKGGLAHHVELGKVALLSRPFAIGGEIRAHIVTLRGGYIVHAIPISDLRIAS